MTTENRWRRAAEILDELFQLPEAGRHGAWWRHPESDAAVRAEVESLLAASQSGPGYLDQDLVTLRRPPPGACTGHGG